MILLLKFNFVKDLVFLTFNYSDFILNIYILKIVFIIKEKFSSQNFNSNFLKMKLIKQQYAHQKSKNSKKENNHQINLSNINSHILLNITITFKQFILLYLKFEKIPKV
jgi:hypothetical protein